MMKEDNLPFVSVIVPVYNGEKTIEECITSLLNQKYPKDRYEIIIVDNNSTDNTAQIIQRYPVRYLKEEKIKSSYAARNKGVKNAKGEILAFTDADCIASDKWLKEGVKSFDEEKVGCVAGKIKGYLPNSEVEKYLIEKNVLSQEITLNHFFLPFPQTANVFYRKDVFAKIGFFEERWVSGGDADFAWRMQIETSYRIKFSPEAIIFHKHRSTAKAMFVQRIKWGKGSVLLYKKYKNKMPRWGIKNTYKEFIWFLYLLESFIKSKIFSHKQDKKIKYDIISFLGRKIGMFIGSVSNRVYYV